MVDISSAHRLKEMSILPKFKENLLKGSGDMEWTPKCYGQMDRQMDRQTDVCTNEYLLGVFIANFWLKYPTRPHKYPTKAANL